MPHGRRPLRGRARRRAAARGAAPARPGRRRRSRERREPAARGCGADRRLRGRRRRSATQVRRPAGARDGLGALPPRPCPARRARRRPGRARGLAGAAGGGWPERLAEAAAATVAAGRGALLVVPDQRDVAALHAACAARLGAAAVVALTAELGPAERYRRWLAVRRGQVRVVVGTRSAAFAPVERLGLLAVWDDGDDLHAEPRAPYPHVRDVLVLRAHAAGAALLVGGFARTAEAQLLVESGWAREVVAERATVRAAMPRITALEETAGQFARDPDAVAARLPHVAFEAARAALDAGLPVLVQVPRAGYLPWLPCGACRETRPLPALRGPAGPRAGAAGGRRGRPARRPVRRACRTAAGAGGPRALPLPGLRVTAAARRGRRGRPHRRGARPGVPRGPGAQLRAGERRCSPRSGGPAGARGRHPRAEPPAAGGYGAALLLDGWALLSRPDLRVAEETLRRWLAAAALVVPHTARRSRRRGRRGRAAGRAGAGALGPRGARRRRAGRRAPRSGSRRRCGWRRSRAARRPSPRSWRACRRRSRCSGPSSSTRRRATAPDERLRGAGAAAGPAPQGKELAAALAAAQAVRSARKAPDPVRVRLDPVEIG